MELVGLLIGVYAIFVLAELAIGIWTVIALGGVFKKAGEPAWKAWVPFYNQWTFFALSGLPAFWGIVLPASITVLWLVGGAVTSLSNATWPAIVFSVVIFAWAIVALIVTTRAIAGINRQFGLGTGYTVLGFFLYPIWASVLAWGSSQWMSSSVGSVTAPAPRAPVSPSVAENFVMSTGPVTPIVQPLSSPPMPAPAAASLATAPGAFAPPPPPPGAPLIAASPWQAPIDLVPGRTPSAPDPAVFAPPVESNLAAFAPPVESNPAAFAPPVARPVQVDSADDEDRTVVVSRKKAPWILTGPDGRATVLSKPLVIVGRKPVADVAFPDAQLVSVADATRTMSKNHARLRESDDGWWITDLGSTNGVVVVVDTNENPVIPGVETMIVDTFLLGEAQVRLSRES